MEMRIQFPGNKKVSASFGQFTVVTDQPIEGGGEGSAPSPFDLFLSSIGTCAGIFVLGFCQKRGLPTEGLEIVQKIDFDPVKHMVSNILIEITPPKDFPEKYRESLINVANLCSVKKHLFEPPTIQVVTK